MPRGHSDDSPASKNGESSSCSYSRCENRRMLSEYEMSAYLAKKRFMSNYLLWHQHRKVQPVVADESDRNDESDKTCSLNIHRWRCIISLGSLLPKKKKWMMAPM
jgi:hypothetical protein